MPKTLWRIAARSANRTALLASNLANVSVPASRVITTALPHVLRRRKPPHVPSAGFSGIFKHLNEMAGCGQVVAPSAEFRPPSRERQDLGTSPLFGQLSVKIISLNCASRLIGLFVLNHRE
jgi:hypothetical protein